jgi:uncharacterized damage-inducible protein DinB
MGSDQSTIQAVDLSAADPGAPAAVGSGHRFVAALNQQVLRQGIDVIRGLGDEQYVAAPDGLAHSGAGAHFRHIYDYYRCFLRDVESGRVDYDRRDRDPRFETDREHACACLQELIERFEALRGDERGEAALDGATVLEARMDAVGDSDEDGHWNRTTVKRELRFLVSHTIHHYALIAVILKVQGFECGPDFGVAPSTIEYWKQAEA